MRCLEKDPQDRFQSARDLTFALGERRYIRPTGLAQVCLELREVDQAFALLEDALQARDPTVPDLAVDPIWDPVRDDSRFDDLLRRIGLPPSAPETIKTNRPAGTR